MKTKTIENETFQTFKEVVAFSTTYRQHAKTFDCNFTIEAEEKTFKAHSVSICNRDLLFFTDKGTLNYVVDTVGFNNYAELFSIDCDEE